MTVEKSLRPKANPKRPVAKSQRPKRNPMYDMMSPKSIEDRTTREMAKGGKISEYGGKEKYKSKAAMMKHEKAEPASVERTEKMAMGGKCRGMGAAKKGGNYSKNG